MANTINNLDDSTIGFVLDDGGRAAAGFKGNTGDCVVRAICIATKMDYQSVYDEMFRRNRLHHESKGLSMGKASPRNGSHKAVYGPYLTELGWVWTPTMFIGAGCKVHLRSDELPSGVVIVRLSRHIATVIDGVLHDSHDSSRDGARCVYGHWTRQ